MGISERIKIKQIGQRIKVHRESRGFHQEDLSKGAGISQSTISKIEAGQADCSLHNLMCISDFFGVDLKYFLEGNEF